MDSEIIPVFEAYMNDMIPGLKIEREDEDENNSISYLNCKMNRREDNTIGFVWWHKEYSSRQILNFHSNHPLFMKRNVVNECIKNALSITTDDYLFKAVSDVKKILRRSSYPETFFLGYLNQALENLMKIEISSMTGAETKIEFIVKMRC